MIKPETRSKIKGFLEGFLETQIVKHQKKLKEGLVQELMAADAEAGKLKPFHLAILPPEAVRLAAFERSFSTSLGNTFEECARLVALDNHPIAERAKRLVGTGPRSCLDELEKIKNEVEKGHGFDYLGAIQRVLDCKGNGEVEVKTITDIYLKTTRGVEYFFEIKSPKPNKGQGLEVTDRLLRTHILKKDGPPKVKTFYAMAYNPYGSRSNYNHSFAIHHLDMQNQVLLENEFWDIVGGTGTFEELLSIYSEVGREKGHQVIDRIGYSPET